MKDPLGCEGIHGPIGRSSTPEEQAWPLVVLNSPGRARPVEAPPAMAIYWWLSAAAIGGGGRW
jgi:hypothetical protein